jgi:hypothetical protein
MCCGWLQYSLENEKSERVGSASRKVMSSLASNPVPLVSTVPHIECLLSPIWHVR